MEETFLNQLEKQLQIAKDRLMVEFYEMIILNKLLKSSLATVLIFKGGTAIRLAYQSPRFSEDLDFSLLKKIKFSDFKKEIEKLPKEITAISISELKEKYYTHFALVKVKDTLLKQAFSIKVEVSKRPVIWKEKADYQFMPLVSPTGPLSLSGLVVTLERCYKDKTHAVYERTKGRDFFDLWWLAQRLNKKISPLRRKFDKKLIINELHVFLPRNYWQFLHTILALYESRGRAS